MSHQLSLIHKGDVPVSSPFFGPDKTLFTVGSTGSIFKYRGNVDLDDHLNCDQWGNTSGQPMGLVVSDDKSSQIAFVCDAAHQAILRITRSKQNGDAAGQQDIEAIVREYEGVALRGPCSVCASRAGSGNTMIYFTDSGPFGETSLQNAEGSVFAINTMTQLLIPLSVKSLACPYGIALSPDDSTVYVCETAANRILRFVQHPAGVYHCSVFHQFSGRFGPTAVCVSDAGDIYVAHYDFPDAAEDGRVVVLDSEGNVTARLSVPGPQITGLCLDPQQQYLIITEQSTQSVYRHRVERLRETASAN